MYNIRFTHYVLLYSFKVANNYLLDFQQTL